MNAQRSIVIDPQEVFPHLPRAPIVEAVIHWRGRSERVLQREAQQALRSSLPDYPVVQPQHELQLKSEVGPQGGAHSQRTELYGLRIETPDRRNIAQFTREGFVFSRTTPYEDWSRFVSEAKRLWKIHVEHACPTEIERLGVRFINRIVPIDPRQLDRILLRPPAPPDGLPFPVAEFLHRDLYDVPEYAYRVQVIQTSQPPSPPENAPALILDIDVFTTTSVDLDDTIIDQRLSEMRWLKNRAFFAALTEDVVRRFKEPVP